MGGGDKRCLGVDKGGEHWEAEREVLAWARERELIPIILPRRSQKRTGHPSYPGSSLGVFLGSGLSREVFLATVLLHLHCLLVGVLGWGSVQHFDISADVRRAI